MISTLLLALAPAVAQDPIGALLDEFVAAGRAPGISVAIASADGSLTAWTRGHEDREGERPLHPHHQLMSGSVGKTYFAALAMQLIDEGRIAADDKLAKFLGERDWYARLPNAETITLASLMRHTSGMVDPIAMPQTWQKLEAAPTAPWAEADWVELLLDQDPLFPVGESWAYTDANYLLLGLALEEVLEESVYRAVWERFLQPLQLHETRANTSPDLPGLAQGWRTWGLQPGAEAKPAIVNGRFYINPQMEWCGGGYRSTTSDLARWGAALFGGRAISAQARQRMLEAAVDAQLFPGDRYGYGVIVSQTPQGPAHGHSGFFPGYLTEMMWFPKLGVCIAVQFNTDQMARAGHPRQIVMQVAAILAEDQADDAAQEGGD
ncbi:MAG: hypothetical protein CMJ94_00085 [Planctomycetes bacterium]|nr:hypothetical protein [Planctomycetota bacterium]